MNDYDAGAGTTAIRDFRGKWAPLSNFYRHPFEWNGHTWKTSEHAFQAAKCAHPSDAKAVREAATPNQAKRIGRMIAMRHDWDDNRIGVMRSILDAKFSVEPMRDVLLATGNAELVEGNTWGDRYWGVCRGTGQNHLGKLLVETRDRIREREREAVVKEPGRGGR